MAYSQKDINFIKEMKARGYSPEVTFQKLQEVRAKAQGMSPQKSEPEKPKFGQRLKEGFKTSFGQLTAPTRAVAGATANVVKEGFKRVGEGVESFKQGTAARQVVNQNLARLDNELKTGQITKEEYDRLKPQFERVGYETATKKQFQGAASIARGATETTLAPMLGSAEAAITPIATKGIESLDTEKQQKIASAFQRLEEIGNENPAIRDSLSVIAELTGFGAAKKVTQATVKAGAKTLPKVAEVGAGLAGKTKGIGKNYLTALDKDIALRRGIKETIASKKDAESVAQMLVPKLNVKNYREAVRKGKAVAGKESFLKGTTPSQIILDDELVEASKTVSSKIQNAGKMTKEELPTAIDNAISKIATPLREAMREVKVPIEIKKKVDDVWTRVKNLQVKNPRLQVAGVKNFQKEFENDYLSKIKQIWENDEGFRNTNAEDLWDIVIAYDQDWTDTVKDLSKTVDGLQEAQRKIWLQNRKILRDIMDEITENIDNVEVKKSFKEMSNLYKAKSAILNNVEPIKSKKSGITKEILKETAKIAIPSSIVTGAIASRF